MSISRTDVERIARLAALDVDEESLPVLTSQIGCILEYVSQLEAVQGGDQMPGLAHVMPLRSDDVRPAGLSAPPGQGAPAFRDGLFLVPRLRGVGSESAPEDSE